MEEKELRKQNTTKQDRIMFPNSKGNHALGRCLGQYCIALYTVCDEGISLALLTLERMSAAISLSVSSVFLPLPPPERWDWVSRMESNSWEGGR